MGQTHLHLGYFFEARALNNHPEPEDPAISVPRPPSSLAPGDAGHQPGRERPSPWASIRCRAVLEPGTAWEVPTAGLIELQPVSSGPHLMAKPGGQDLEPPGQCGLSKMKPDEAQGSSA